MNERIQVVSRTDKWRKGERKAIDEEALRVFWEFDEPTQQSLVQEISLQIHRLATVSDTYIAPPERQLSIVLGAYGMSDSAVARAHGTHPPSLWKYRRNVNAALAFVVSTQFPNLDIKFRLPEDTMNIYRTLVALEERSQLVRRKISQPAVQKKLRGFPHVEELLEYYALRNDVTSLFDQHGVPYGKESRPNDSIKAFLFGKRRRGSTRQFDGVKGVEAWGRKLVFARWCTDRINCWGEDVSGRISNVASRITGRPIPKGHPHYQNYYGAKRFFEKALETEFLGLQRNKSPEFYEFFPSVTGKKIGNEFGEVNVSASYRVFAQHRLEPHSLVDIMQQVVNGEHYYQIAQNFSQAQYYSAETTETWLMLGTLVVERCLVTKRPTLKNTYDIVALDRTARLRDIKQQLVAVSSKKR